MAQNHLKNQKSPYLLQHVDNPVDWFPWGNGAFEKAKKENKPIFLSIGYSTCHWCHVMAHESFEDLEIADILNKNFVSIKVDREERPDIDSVYMMVCQMMTGHGGWPLTIFMSPDQKPFFAGTYFPKKSAHGRVGLADLLLRVRTLWDTQRKEIEATTKDIENALTTMSGSEASLAKEFSATELVTKCRQELSEMFDIERGGFGQRPKFPSPHKILFLLEDYRLSRDETSLKMAEKTLFEMHRGGIFDHIGGGFHRYSTDENWELPHFEKMLYDQAWISYAYITAYELTQNIFYKKVAEQVFECVENDFLLKGGGFASGHDADSEGEEGKFYLWSLEELKKIATPEEFDFLNMYFFLHEEGNYLDEATLEKTKKNIFILKKSLQGQSQDQIAAFFKNFENLRRKIKFLRDQRAHPLRDEKVLTDWNAQMAASLMKAARLFKDGKRWQALAQKNLAFIESELSLNGYLFHRICDGELLKHEFLEDQVSCVWALMHAYETQKDRNLLEKIRTHLERIEEFYKHPSGGYFMTAKDQSSVLTRLRELYDGASPSANSVYLLCLQKLSAYMKQTTLQDEFIENIKGLSEIYLQSPSSYAFAMTACYFFLHPYCEKDLC